MKVVVLIVCAVLAGWAEACCPSYWTQYGKSCYRFIGYDRYWQEAEAECNKLSPSGQFAHLVSINSREENSFVHSLFREEGGAKYDAYWLGGADQYQEGTFEWTDGTPFDFQFWRSEEPNNDGNEDCIEVYESDAGWNDLDCYAGRTFVCEVPLSE